MWETAQRHLSSRTLRARKKDKSKRIASHFCVPSSLEKAKIAFVNPWRLTIVRPTTRIKLVNKCIFFKEIPSVIFKSDSCCSIFVQRSAFSLIFSLVLLDYSRSSVSSCTPCGPTSLNSDKSLHLLPHTPWNSQHCTTIFTSQNWFWVFWKIIHITTWMKM